MAQSQDLSLNFSYWLVSHKQTLRTWWAIVLMATIAGSLLWSLWFFTVFFSQERSTVSQILDAANGTASFRVVDIQPSGLTIGTPTVIVRDETHADLVVMVTNANANWGASSVSGHFVVDGKALLTERFFINPSVTRPVIDVNEAVIIGPAPNVQFVIDETIWARSSASALPEPRFTVAHQLVDPSTTVIDGQSRVSVTLRAEVTNASVYNFYHVEVPVIAYNGNTIVGVASIGVDRWATLMMKPITVSLSNAVTAVTKIDVLPQVSRFDSGNTYR